MSGKFITKENAKEIGKKGGQGNKGKTSFAKSLVNRKNCNTKCPEYERCPFMHLSKPEFKGKCALKAQESDVQNWTISIMDGGPEGIKETLRSLVVGLMKDAKNGTFRERKGAIYTLKDIYEMIYGKNINQNITAEVKAEITVDNFKNAMKEMKE